MGLVARSHQGATLHCRSVGKVASAERAGWQGGSAGKVASVERAGWGGGSMGRPCWCQFFFDFKCVSEKSGDLISVIERNVVILFSNIRFFDN